VRRREAARDLGGDVERLAQSECNGAQKRPVSLSPISYPPIALTGEGKAAIPGIAPFFGCVDAYPLTQ
jgi:hypothetical protein